MVSEDTCVRSRFTIGHEHKAHVPKVQVNALEQGPEDEVQPAKIQVHAQKEMILIRRGKMSRLNRV